MTSDHRTDSRVGLLHELIALPRETEWLEFKVNDAEPKAIEPQPIPRVNHPAHQSRRVSNISMAISRMMVPRTSMVTRALSS